MKRIIAIVVLATFSPLQLYAGTGIFSDFNDSSSTQREYFVPRGPDKPAVQPYRDLDGKILEKPPKSIEEENTGTNWWLWGGLAVVAGGVAALVGGGAKGGGSSSSGGGGGGGTTTVTGSW